MTYEIVARISQTAALLMFIGLFIGVIAYAFWPGNRERFDKAQREALDLDQRGQGKGRRG